MWHRFLNILPRYIYLMWMFTWRTLSLSRIFYRWFYVKPFEDVKFIQYRNMDYCLTMHIVLMKGRAIDTLWKSNSSNFSVFTFIAKSKLVNFPPIFSNRTSSSLFSHFFFEAWDQKHLELIKNILFLHSWNASCSSK